MTDPKRSLRVPASRRAKASVSAAARFCPRLSPLSLSASEFRVLRAFCLLGLLALSDCVFSPGYRSLYLTLCVSLYLCLNLSLWPSLLLPLSLRSLSCLQVPDRKQTFQSPQPVWDCRTTRGEAVPRVLRPCPPRPGAPPGSAPSAPPARTWSPRPRRRRCHLRAWRRGLEF